MAVLSFTGLAIAAPVSEQQRTDSRSRLDRRAMAGVLRRALNEFAAAFVDEINKALTVIGNHVRVTTTKPEGKSLGFSLRCSTIEFYRGRLTTRGTVNDTVVSVALAIARPNGEARL